MVHAALGDPIGGLECGCGLDAGLHASEEYRRRSAHRPQPGRMHAAAGRRLDHRAIRHRQIQRPIGNRHPVYVPNGCFPCIGEDQWITLSGTKRRGVAIALPHHASPDLAADPSLGFSRGPTRGGRPHRGRDPALDLDGAAGSRDGDAAGCRNCRGRGAPADGPSRRSASGEESAIGNR